MPNSLNAAKRHRQNQVARLLNRSARSRVRTFAKKFESELVNGDRETAEFSLKQFNKAIDTAAAKGQFHRNTAARKKSRLYKRFARLTSKD